MFFLHNHGENEARPLCFFKKIYMYEVKANDLQQYILIALNLAYNRNELLKAFDH